LTRHNHILVALLALAGAGASAPPVHAQGKDYLTGLEADKVRDAETPEERIKLFLLFGADRLKKFQYELSRGSMDRRRAERLDALLQAFAGCMDDASELMELARMKQQEIAKAIKLAQGKGKEYLAELDKLKTAAGGSASYKDALQDAVDATTEMLEEAEKAAKEIAPPPVRRRQ
jgi:hypothetical protein